MICCFSTLVFVQAVSFSSICPFLWSPVLFPAPPPSLHTFFPLQLGLAAPPHQANMAPLSQFNEIESSQFERSHFYSCHLIIEEADSCSTKAKRDGSDGGREALMGQGSTGAISHTNSLSVSFLLPVLSTSAALKFFLLSKCKRDLHHHCWSVWVFLGFSYLSVKLSSR